MERLVDRAAAETGIDPVELRRRNHIRPDELPYKAPSDMTYDSGAFTEILDRAVAASDWAGYEARKADSRARGRLRGRGIGQYLEVTAPAQNEMGGIRFEGDGTVTIVTGTLDYGQGHATPFAQVLASRLGLPFERIRLVQGDSDELIAGGGTGGSKSIMASGTAIVEASDKVIEQGRQIAAHVLEAGVADIEFAGGRFVIAGTDRSIGLLDLAERLRTGLDLPPDVPRSLDVKHVHKLSPSSFPNGCHIAEVEVDPDTGTVEVVHYAMVNDFGTLINPLLVEGQLHGGIVQGIGQALMERTAYDEGGQPVTGSYMDYALPRAEDAPFFSLRELSGPGADQSPRRQGLRRGRLRRRPHLGHERARRRPARQRGRPHRHAGNAPQGMAGPAGPPIVGALQLTRPCSEVPVKTASGLRSRPSNHGMVAARSGRRIIFAPAAPRLTVPPGLGSTLAFAGVIYRKLDGSPEAMASKPKELSNLQRDLLHLALQGPKAKIWLPKASQQSFPTTYAAIVSLQRRGLLDTEPVKDPDILSWKVTKEGRDALKAPKAEPAAVKPAATPVAAPSAAKGKAAPAAAKAPVKPSPPPPRPKPRRRPRGAPEERPRPRTPRLPRSRRAALIRRRRPRRPASAAPKARRRRPPQAATPARNRRRRRGNLAAAAGLEPATFAFEARRSIQLSYVADPGP